MGTCFTKKNDVVRNIRKVMKRKQVKRRRMEEDSDYSEWTVWSKRFGRNKGNHHNTLLTGGIRLFEKRTDILDIINHSCEEEHGGNHADELNVTPLPQPNLSESPEKMQLWTMIILPQHHHYASHDSPTPTITTAPLLDLFRKAKIVGILFQATIHRKHESWDEGSATVLQWHGT